jgi:hypothetical protein
MIAGSRCVHGNQITVLLSGIIDTGPVCPGDPCRAVLSPRDATHIREIDATNFCSGTARTKEYYHLGYKSVKSLDSQPTFQMNISPPSSESKKSKEIL